MNDHFNLSTGIVTMSSYLISSCQTCSNVIAQGYPSVVGDDDIRRCIDCHTHHYGDMTAKESHKLHIASLTSRMQYHRDQAVELESLIELESK